MKRTELVVKFNELYNEGLSTRNIKEFKKVIESLTRYPELGYDPIYRKVKSIRRRIYLISGYVKKTRKYRAGVSGSGKR